MYKNKQTSNKTKKKNMGQMIIPVYSNKETNEKGIEKSPTNYKLPSFSWHAATISVVVKRRRRKVYKVKNNKTAV